VGQVKKCVVLVSGGLDSATTLAIARHEGYDCYALSVLYGQRHANEISAAKNVGSSIGVIEHRLLSLDLSTLGGSALTDPDIPVPKADDASGRVPAIPVTYVPARNTIFLGLALAWAEVLGAFDIFIGVNALDYSGYPDCREEFIQSFERTANLATAAAVEGKGRFRIQTPIIHKTKAQVISWGMKLGVDYSLTHSCYDPDKAGLSCGQCDSCLIRRRGFAEAGLEDPLPYRA
jgi:7-cyano-7-deazaguanine synthase